MSSPVQAVPSPLQDFLEFLYQSRDTAGIIKVPVEILENTTQYLSELSSVPRNHVEEMLAVIDHEESAICGRLELQAFTVVYDILSLTEEGSAYERGLALLTHSLYEIPTSPLPESRLRAAKKAELGDIALLNLFGCFTTTELSRSTRRWMGILALELLKGCDQNKNLMLQKAGNLGRRLGDIILHGRCHVLKLIAGFIVCEIWPDGTPTRDLWPTQRNSKLHRQFPKVTDQASQWIIDFERFVGGLAPNSLMTKKNSEVVFAYAVSIGENIYYVDGQSAILVTISDELNIVIPLHTTNTANYLDININQIEQIMREKKEFHFHCSSSPSRLFEVLTIRISKSSKEAYYFNARGLFADSLVLVFTSAGAASTVQQRILGIRSRIPCNLGTSQSGPVDISRQLSEDLDEPSAMQLVTKLSEQLSNDLVSATGQANETHRKNSTTSVAHLSLPECNESPLEYISQPKLSTSVASPHDGNTPQLMALIDGAISPVEPHQFDELSSKLTTVEYNFEDTSDDESPNPAKRLGGPSLLGCGQAIWDRQCTLASKYVGLPADDCPVRIPSIEQDENYENPYHAKTKTYISRKKHTNQTESQPFERVGQRGMSKNFSSPDVKIGRVGRQDLTKLSQRMRRNVGEPPIGLSLFPEPTYGDATKKDRRKREDSRPALRTNFLFPDRQPKDLELFRVQSRGQIGGKSKTASADEQNRYEDEFDFPISARKAPSVSAAHVPTPIAVMCAQSSFNAARKPKTKPIPPPKPTLNCPSKRPDSQIHDGRRPKAIAGTTASISSKRIRNNEDDDATDETNWNPGFVVDQAKGSKPPQGQRKKQLNRKSQPRMKPIRAKDDLAFSTHKALNPKIQKSRKLKAVPVPLAQSRSRRVAALTANRKIQGLVGSDESEDEEDVESIHVKEKSIKRPGQENRTPMSHPSAIMQSNSSIINANSRSPFITSREGKGPIMSNHDTATITSAVPCVVPTNNENEKAESSDGVDILTDKLVQLANGVKIDDNTRQSLPVNASDTLPLDGRSDHRPQSELPTVNLKTLEVQDSATGATLEEPELVHDNTMPLPTFTYKTLTPEANPSDHVDALNDTGSGFFEEATAFSHEDSKSLVENPTDEGTSKSPTLDSNFENIHDPSACEEVNIDNIPTLANASSNPIKSTPKVSVAAKLQSALSSVKKLHFPTKTMEKLQRISKGGALTGAEVTAPRLDNTVLDNMATRGTKETIVSSKQAVCPDAMRFGQGLVEENGVPSLKKTLQRRESQPGPTVDSTMPPVTQSSHRTPTTCAQVRSSIITPYALEAKNDAEIGKSDKVISINEASLQGVQKSSKSLSLNPDSGKTNSETFQGDLEGRILSALRAKNVQHGLEGSSKQEFDSAKLTHTSPMDKSRAQLVMDEVVHADKPTIALLDCDRKPNVISFDSKGPRNQGILSSRRVRPVQAPDDQTPEMSVNVKNKALKRKIQDFGEDNFSSVGNEAAVKRPRTSIDVPRTDEKAPERVQKRSISIIKESTQKTSSQSTRVDENGSPLPFLDSRKIGFQRSKRRISFENAAQSPVAKQGAEDGNDLFMSKDGLEVLSPGLPFLRNLSPQSASSFRFVPLSCTKHRPSSPNAPSEIIGEYTAHKVDSSGKFVNIRTDNVVMAVRPPDPFVGIQKNRQNDFIELLRRSSNIPDKGSSAIAATTAQDPDKTLVMGDLAREKNNSDASSIRPSPSSDSSESNEYSPQDYPSSSGDGDDEDDEWAAALQPHQCETLEVLYEISHRLIGNLVSKETAVNDLVSDYRRGGRRIIDEFEKSRRQALEMYQTEIRTHRRKLTKTYEGVQHELALALIDPKWNADFVAAEDNCHETLRKKMQEAFALCEE